MSIDEQIAQLKAMAEGMGYVVNSVGLLTRINITGDTGITIINDEPESIHTAHRFLCSLKAGVPVDVAKENTRADETPQCDYVLCNFWTCPWTKPDTEGTCDVPGPDCPMHSKPGPGYHFEGLWMPDEVA